MSTDLISGYLTNPQSQNRYQFCYNNPVNNTDPMGLDPVEKTEPDVVIKDPIFVIDTRLVHIKQMMVEDYIKLLLIDWDISYYFSVLEAIDLRLEMVGGLNQTPNYRQHLKFPELHLNFSPSGGEGIMRDPNWAYLYSNDFFGGDSKAIEILYSWYKTDPSIIADFVVLLKKIKEELPELRKKDMLGHAGEWGGLRNMEIFFHSDYQGGIIGPVFEHPDTIIGGSCVDCYYNVDEKVKNIKNLTIRHIFRVYFYHQAHIFYLKGTDLKENGIILDIWQKQDLKIYSFKQWFKWYHWAMWWEER